jgi:hypothetical protein
MEFLKFNSGGQWTLEKSSEFSGDKDEDYMSYRSRSIDGRLPEDHGHRGELHNVGTVRAPRKLSEHKMEGKVPTPIKSAARDRSPGLF